MLSFPRGSTELSSFSCQVPGEELLKWIYFLQLKNSSVSKATAITWFPKQFFLLLFLFEIDYWLGKLNYTYPAVYIQFQNISIRIHAESEFSLLVNYGSSSPSWSLGFGFYEVSPTRELSDVQEELSTHCSSSLNTISIRSPFSTQPAIFPSIIEKYRHVLFDRYGTEYSTQLSVYSIS